MSRRKDRLASLLRLKEIREDQAKAEVARANQAEKQAVDEVAQARQRATDAMDVLDHPDDEGSSMPVALVRALQIAGWASAEQLQLAEQEYERTVERRNESQRQLQQAAIGRRSIEKLAKRREAEAVAARRDAADRAMDELYLLSRGRGR